MSSFGVPSPSCCKVCNRPDSAEDMVACDICGTWFHYTCAGVTSSVKNIHWCCGYCSSRGAASSNSAISVSSGSSSAQLRLKQLEESKALDDRLLLQQAERERAFLAEKHQIEAEIQAERRLRGSTSSFRSRHSGRSRHSYRNEVRTWINQSEDTPAKAVDQQSGAATSTPIVTTTGILALTVPNQRVIPPAPRHHPMGDQEFIQPPLIKPSDVQAISILPHTTEVQSGVTRKVSIATNEPPKAVINAAASNPSKQSSSVPHREAFHQFQQRQHPSCPPKRQLPPTRQSGPEESVLPGTDSHAPAQNCSESRIGAAASDMQQTRMQQPQRQNGGHIGHDVPPNLHASSQQAPSFPTQWQQNDSSSFIQQQSSTATQMPVGPPTNPSYPMSFYQPYYPGWQNVPASTGVPQNLLSSTAVRAAPGVYASQTQHDQAQNSRQTFPGQVPSFYPGTAAEGVLTAQQLAARQVVSRDLPKFSGDPLEWPMFINAFESTTAMCGIQPDENLARLQKSLVGPAWEKVQSILTLPAAIPEILETLRDECGRPEQLVHCLLAKIRRAPSPNVNRLETLITFGREVRNLVTYIEGANLQNHLSNPMLLSELVGKLPPSLRLDWGLHTQKVPHVTLKAFSDYVSSVKSAACQVSLPTDSHYDDNRRGKKEKGGFVNAHTVEDNRTGYVSNPKTEFRAKNESSAPKPCPACNKTDHKLRSCERFASYNVDKRRHLVDQSKLCHRCLGSHGKWPCRSKQFCEVDGCKEPHHQLLHTANPKPANVVLQASSSGVISAHCSRQAGILFKVLPVLLTSNGKTVSTFAFLDDGSNVTLIEEEIAEDLGLSGCISTLCIQWTGSVTRKEPTSRQVNLNIAGVNGGPDYAISDVQTVPRLDLPQQSLDYQALSNNFPHLRGLPVTSYTNAVPRILIGLDNASLKVALDKRERRSGEPIAAKTRLGWTIFGGGRGTQRTANVMLHVCNCTEDEKLHSLVKDYFSVESIGVNPMLPLESPEDQRARQLLAQTTRRTESGRFECGLLWKSDDFEFPNSYKMAERRLACLEKKLRSKPELRRNVLEQIEEYLERGYAHKTTEDELRDSDARHVWYLPLGVVQHPRKPGKVRIVWDAAARVGETSLNSMLLAGPDLLTPLLKVMCGFRQRQYAAVGDVRQMFHQLLVKPSDRQAQRFLFRSDTTHHPTIYVMDVVIFGASCSPCLAQHVKNTNARDYEELYPDAASAIINNTYVDDFLDSRDTVDEAVRIVEEVRWIFDKAGFEIRNWQSNSEELLRRVGVDVNETIKRFSVEKSTVAERVLGMTWDPKNDIFVFVTQFREDLQALLSGDIIPTKRQVLRVVMSYFDPLGIVATYTVHGKILIQDVWRSGVKWDDKIAAEDYENWQRWAKLAPNLREVRIPRCYFPNYNPGSYDSLELHVFVDASLTAYCAAAYFRIFDNDAPRCALVAAKTKVTPLKPQSIPRNELCAGVIGVRLLKSIQENHSIPVQKRYIWTDSTTVLAWLRADPRKYRQFVAFRVAEIQSETNVDEWHYVPSSLNIADKGTKWGNGPCFDPENPWFTGPTFLHGSKNEWPRQPTMFSDPQEEFRVVHHHAAVCDSVIDFAKFSRWDDLVKSLAYVYHFVHRCRTPQKLTTNDRIAVLEQKDYSAAEASVWRVVQGEVYSDEISTLRKNSALPNHQGKSLQRSSPIAKLSPFLDDKGVLRMGSRIKQPAVYYSYDFQNPVIVPRTNHITRLLIHKYHQRYGHANVDTVVNELRQRCYIPKTRSVVKAVVKQCMWCTVYRAKPVAPSMGMLPHPRVTPYVRPFTFTGLDYFGPLIIKRRRSNEKRWVALYTCLTVRAVHVEVVHTLSAESCKMAMRRFISRRGTPQQIYSDNGTNFRGAARELADETRIINRELATSFTNAEIEWVFNPPSAPHMGGVWERKVRSIKDALKSLHHDQHLNDEELTTFLAEAEMIVNSHPLTFVPLEDSTEEAVTPNNFLLMSSSGSNNSSRIPVNEEVPLRVNWRLMQQLLNQFWKRWIQGYLPTIARRTKWFSDVRPLQVGDPVVIVDEAVRNGWLRGRVVETYPAKDGQVRKVDVKTSSGVFQRPAIKVALLDVQQSGKAGQD